MELLEVTQTHAQREQRVACLSWTALAAQQAASGRALHVLVSGEHVVLRREDGEFHAGRVMTSAEIAGEPHYVLEVGVRLPAAWAALRVGRTESAETATAPVSVEIVQDTDASERDADIVDAEIVEETDEVVAMLGDLRSFGITAPQQRRSGAAGGYTVPAPRRPLLDTML